MSSGVELATAYVTLKADGRQLGPSAKKALAGVETEAHRSGTRSGKRMALGFGRTFGGVGAALGVAALIKSSSKLEQSYSKTMALVAAATGAPKTEITRLDALAMKLGADTQFSANQAAGAMLDLGKAGISTSDIYGGALKGTLLLASAGGTELGVAATIASNAMNTFNLRGRDMNKIAAALAGGANASSASVESLGQALSQVGPGAKNAGLSLQQTVGVLSAFDAAGIKGSDSGTSLKTMLARLVPQTDKARTAMSGLGLDFVKADGSFVSITNVAEQLRQKLGPLSEAQRQQALTTIFGSDASRAATVLMNEGAAGLGKYIKATKDQTAAEKMSKAAMSGTAGAMERLSGSAETAKLALGKALAPEITKLANWTSTQALPAVTSFITGMQNGTGAGGDLANTLGQVASAGKDLAGVGKGVLGFFNGLPGPVKKFGTEALVAYAAMSKFQSLTAGSRLGGFIGDLRNSETRLDAVGKASRRLGEGLRTAAGAGGVLAVSAGLQQTNKDTGTLLTTLGGAATGFAAGGPIGAAVGGLGGLFLGLSRASSAAGQAAKGSISDWSSLKTTLDGVTGSTTAATRAMVLSDLTKSKAIKTTRELGFSDRETVDAIVNGGNVRGALTNKIEQQITATKGLISAQEKQNSGLRGAAAANAIAKDKELKAHLASLQGLQKDIGASDKAVAAKRREIAATRTYTAAINTLPKAVKTDIKTNGLEPTRAAIVGLAAKYDLARKDVRTLITENGGKPTRAMIDSIITAAKRLDKQHAAPKVTVNPGPAFAGIGRIRSALANIPDEQVNVIVHRKVGAGATAGGSLGLGATGGARGMTVPRHARGGTVLGQRRPYGDKVLTYLAPGEEVVANQYGQADRNRPLLKAISANRMAAGGTAGGAASIASGRSTQGARTVIVQIGDREFEGYIDELADSRYYANRSLNG